MGEYEGKGKRKDPCNFRYKNTNWTLTGYNKSLVTDAPRVNNSIKSW